MNARVKKNIVIAIIGSVPLFLMMTGCNNAPQYKYQAASNVAMGEGGGSASSGGHGGGSASATTETQNAPVAAEPVVPAVPELSVGELLQNSHSYDNKTIKVTGRRGKLLPYYNISYIINDTDDSYITFSYEKMSNSDKGTLSRLNTLKVIAVSGVWNASKKTLAGEELVQPAM